MTLAEGLVLRADLKKRIEQLKERLRLSALVQDGELPPENPEHLLVELDRLLAEMTDLVKRINKTNLQSCLPNGQSLTDALADRDSMTLLHSVLQATIEAGIAKVDRLGRAEIKKVPTMKIADLRSRIDEIARQRRELDTLIQATNWKTELAN